MEMNETDTIFSRRQEKNLLKVATAVARDEFANPQREGCPDSETLNLLARRRPSLAESPDLIDHIGTCSPCVNEYSRCRAVYKRTVLLTYALTSAAAVALFAIAASRSWHSPRGDPTASPPTVAHSPGPEQHVTPVVLDLRMKGVSRSDTPNGQFGGAPLRLPRSRLSLSIQLPTGSEDGVYDVVFIGPTGKSMLETSGEAKLQNFVEVLPVSVSLDTLAPGLYQLRLRRAQTQWSSYSVLLE